jgi:hypothetical protein
LLCCHDKPAGFYSLIHRPPPSWQISQPALSLDLVLSAQITNHSNFTENTNTRTSSQLTDLSAEVKHLTSLSTAHLSKCPDHYHETLGCNLGGLTDAIENNSTVQQNHIRGFISDLEQSVATGFSGQSQVFREQARVLNEILELQRQLNGTKDDKECDELDQHIQNCIDRLQDLKNSARGDWSVGNSEAQLIHEDLISILEVLLKQISFPKPWEVDRKRKRSIEGQDHEATETDKTIEQMRMRIKKRMKGILNSSQTAEFRDSSSLFWFFYSRFTYKLHFTDWQKGHILPGRKVQSHNGIWETPSGTLAITAVVLNPISTNTQTRSESETVTQVFAGSLTLMPKTKRRKMKLRAFFAQHIMRAGAFLLHQPYPAMQ